MDQTLEQWRPVVGYEGLYEVSSHGRVRSVTRIVLRRNGNPQTVKGMPRKPVCNTYGYFAVVLSSPQKRETKSIHVLVLSAFVGPANGLHCRHLDGNKLNNHLSNLAYGTRKENEADKLRHGRRPHGELNGQSRLTSDNVRFIREHPEMSGSKLASLFNVHPGTIGYVRRGETWRHVNA